jgi:hypothetical protein
MHLTFLCEAQEGQRPQQKIHDENRFLMLLVRLATPVPCQDFNPRLDLGFS